MRLYVGGSFDLFHAGHVAFLRECKQYGEVIVAVNSDAFHESYRGKPPVVSERNRLEVVLGCRYVDRAFIVADHASQPLIIAATAPTHIVHGDDWVGESLLRQLGIDRAFLYEHGIQMMYLERPKPVPAGRSSTSIREQL